MIQITVLPEVGVTRTKFGDVQDFGNNLVISIVSPGRVHPRIIGTNVHQFSFHDVTEEYFLENENRIVLPMDKGMAEAIAEVAMNNRHCERWIIHCEAGVSRSPGVAIALARYIKCVPSAYGLMKMFPYYNRHVSESVDDAMRKKIVGMVTNLRMQFNFEGEE